LFPRLGGAGKKWSLGPTRRLLEEVGNPHEQFASIHVGGTNGKGSVAAMVYHGLRRAGFRVGLYTSPHLVEVRERIVVDDRPIGEEAFAAWTSHLQSAVDETDASFFEATTAIALADFAARGVQVAVVEVGLGGRLDSTNVLRPVVAGVTNVGLDHTEYLGPTLVDIAREKAGIAKSDTPFVVGEAAPEPAAVLREVAAGAGAEIVDVPPGRSFGGPLRLEGGHQRRNGAVAEAILHALPPHLRPDPRSIAAGFAEAWLPGRADRRGRWIFDVAHNPAGMEALVGTLTERPPPGPLHAVLGILRDKDASAMVHQLAAVADRLWLTTPPSAPAERRPHAGESAALGDVDVQWREDFDACLHEAGQGAGTVVISGSFHTVGDAMVRLPGFRPLG
jgi:dihydrofolate synthase/folylpolyglutamate synthase